MPTFLKVKVNFGVFWHAVDAQNFSKTNGKLQLSRETQEELSWVIWGDIERPKASQISAATFEEADHQLNLAWYALPMSIRHQLLENQRAWLKNRDLLSAEDKIIETQNRTTYLRSLR